MKKRRKEDKNFSRYTARDFNSLLEVGISLSSEKDSEKIINVILEKAIEITDSDGASIFLIENVKQDSLGGARPSFTQKLRFHRARNRNRRSFEPSQLMDISENSIAGYVALTGNPLRIRDVYVIDEDVPYKFLNDFDKEANYRTKSVLAVPVKTAKGKVLGVLQLVNKLRSSHSNRVRVAGQRAEEKAIIAFSAHDEKLMQGFASQAAIALENAKLTQDINNLFESFVKASVTAIESRDPTTSGHSDRVADFTVRFAQTIDQISTGPYEKIAFSTDQIRELRYAALLHDFGKIGVRENVLLKSKKLYPNELEQIIIRLDSSALKKETLIWKKVAKDLVELAREGKTTNFEAVVGEAMLEIEDFSRQIDHVREKIYQANEPQVMSGDFNIKKLLEWVDNMSKSLGQLVLTSEEAYRLSIGRGTLSESERREIESHVSHTYTFLSQIAWTDDLANVAEIAHAHHEKLDGTGYPRRLSSDQIPIQARMMTISDIYDALTAMDRPYKKAASPERAIDILHEEAKSGKLDKALLDVFVEAGIFKGLDRRLRLVKKAG